MKKLLLSAIALGVAGFLGVVGYVHTFDQDQAAKLLAQTNFSGKQQEVAKVFFENGCQYCHSPNAEMPFYAKIPGVSSMMENDVATGNRFFRLDKMLEGMKDPTKLSEADLAKLETVLRNDTMPIASFIHIHWGSRPDEQEKKTVLDWIHQQRAEHFVPKNTAGVDPTRLVQPIPDALTTDPRKVALGDQIYHDGRLSGDGTVACSNCHQLDKGGVDGLTTSTGIHGQKGGINAPTVYNAAFNHLQFWDGRAKDLADQAKGPPLNPVEMGSHSFDEILAKFKQDHAFMQEFLAAYPELTADTLTDAIAEFEKTLITPNSAFDKFLKGDQNALNDAQKRGYEAFKSAKCDTCHTGTAMGGQSFEYMGLYDDYFKARGTPITADDHGRFSQTKDPADMHRFKVPTLRNVALTAPYMHDGSVKDLKEAVRVMAHYQSGKTLTDQELNDITSFLEALTGEYQGKVLTRQD
ncbi:cytochrome-c peroxidase [Glaesserella parasuis]|uniref:cytochrome-c peroxidase n=1 Tax=Glaesserella parasuis TaxID=738 RepID=UPI0013136A3B|nr:cytochrome-c peroxidase [Glaesserella parasuis]MDG6464534.1 cytochrome-c peroxidase [Glaesserella parasuis]MDO9644897.1 cytochrome-c peroxidase [Glaesserella parasuis]MDO9660744.1 cytochrome-c peroxidase [Glaesserella parasuis]MDO9671961.1 cytochrome-c peroxidase [Glaesserella parasuis]MDO9690020.1 cytochrome-c peroxidase [Glaesserella parasuis]